MKAVKKWLPGGKCLTLLGGIYVFNNELQRFTQSDHSNLALHGFVNFIFYNSDF
jgi:hypothetical protein